MSGERVFDTGRVKIGLAYERKPQVSMDRDALRLQRALLGERNRIDADGIAIIVGVAVFLFVALVV